MRSRVCTWNNDGNAHICRDCKRVRSAPGEYTYTAIGDTYAGIPHIVVTIDDVAELHHAKQTAAARRIARYLWGANGDAIRLGNGRYELVYIGNGAPLPKFMQAKYGQYRTRGTIGIG